MARPLKDGVAYFPKDTDFYNDDKVRMLRAEFGAKGMYMLDYILCEVYGKNGYYIKWDDDKCFLVSDGAGCGCGPDFIREFISGCLRCSFFDKRVFQMFGVLTSAGIQRRYIRMFNGRETIRIIEEYWLLDFEEIPDGILNKVAFKKVFCKENPDKSKENPDKSKENAQRKEKKNKVNNNKYNPPIIPLSGDYSPLGGESPEGEEVKRFKKPTVEEIEAYCLERNNGIDAQKFYDHYQSKGWVIGKSPMKDWKAAVRTWEIKRRVTNKPKSDLERFAAELKELREERENGKY